MAPKGHLELTMFCVETENQKLLKIQKQAEKLKSCEIKRQLWWIS